MRPLERSLHVHLLDSASAYIATRSIRARNILQRTITALVRRKAWKPEHFIGKIICDNISSSCTYFIACNVVMAPLYPPVVDILLAGVLLTFYILGTDVR